MYLMYNDQPPGREISKNGHTKGVLAFDQTSGLWVVHSAPHYPPRKSEGYQWVTSASVNGQNFMCISFPLKRLDVIGHQLLYYQAHVYDWYFPPDFISKFPVLNLIIRGGPPYGPPWFNITSITSLRGQTFTSFAKSNAFEADMYDALIAPRLQQNLLVETWMNGPGDRLPSNCSTTYKVYNIDAISFGNGVVVFNETIDHSKWTIASPMNKTRLRLKSRKLSASYWVCSSDINRKSTQFKRGGGAICLVHKKLWTAFKNIIAHYQACGKTKRGKKVG
ncbi:Plancitoxin-1 [Bulinus truncatus]|nr:Plancitoxin-1 [Bulinus truncatus]